MSTHSHNLNVLYEDNHLIAVFKPARQLTQGDATGDETLMDTIKSYLKQKYQKPGNVFLGLLHRLDRPAQGVVLFAKTGKGASRLSAQFRKHEVTKVYEVLVEGRLSEKEGTLSSDIDGKPASLSFLVLNEGPNETLLQVHLHTGRKHQIRKQFSEIGHPVVGDTRYGSHRDYQPGGIALCSRSIAFTLPTQTKHITVTTPESLCQFQPH